MRVLMIGDVVGKGGRRAVSSLLTDLKSEFSVDFVTLQGENLAAGIGLTVDTVVEMIEAGANVITTGNHVWDKREFIEHLDDPYLPVLRPLNYPVNTPGRGATDDTGPVAVINLIGRVWVGEFDSPFAVVDDLLAGGFGQGKPIVVDFHAEATSEKAALAWHLDGRVAAVVGTHTHVPTSDIRILDKGTGYQTDAGMCGDYNSVIGMNKSNSLNKFFKRDSLKHFPAEGEASLCGLIVESDLKTGLAIDVHQFIVGGDLKNSH